MVCHQYQRKQDLLVQDLADLGKDQAWMDGLRVADFTVRPEKPAERAASKAFIARYEWLGGAPTRGYNHHVYLVEHTALKLLAGVSWFCSPNANSKLLPGAREVLLARGATVSWAPATHDQGHLGSWMTARAVKLLVQDLNEPVIVCGYSDPEAGEEGVIYSSLNWYCLGSEHGTTKMYRDPSLVKPFSKGRWFSDRRFRAHSTWKRFIKKENIKGIVWREPTKVKGTSWNPDWKASGDAGKALKAAVEKFRASCEVKDQPAKKKWCFILGRGQKETQHLRALFVSSAVGEGLRDLGRARQASVRKN